MESYTCIGGIVPFKQHYISQDEQSYTVIVSRKWVLPFTMLYLLCSHWNVARKSNHEIYGFTVYLWSVRFSVDIFFNSKLTYLAISMIICIPRGATGVGSTPNNIHGKTWQIHCLLFVCYEPSTDLLLFNQT